MTSSYSSRAVAGIVGRRARQMVGCAVAAMCIGSLAPSAFAADECGVPAAGSVTCAVTVNNYPTGISYNTAADVTVNAPTGVSVVTTLPATNGITIQSGGAATLTGGATVTTTGAGSNGVVLTSGTGPALLTVGNVTTTGALSAGIIATGGPDQDVTVTTGDVTTTSTQPSAYFFLPSSTAVKATAFAGMGNISVATGAISTAATGASGVMAMADAGSVAVTTGAITTLGDAANGIQAQSNSGDVAVTVTGDINTAGQQATGVYATALNGAANVQAQNVITTGTFGGTGISAAAGAGGASIIANNVAVAGTFGVGLAASSTGGDASIVANDITATGAASEAAYAQSDVGNASITTTGNVVVSGRGGFGLIATSGTGDASVTANNVSTVAALAADTLTSGNAILAQGANATVVVTGTAATAGTAEYNGFPYSGSAIAAIATNGAANVTVNNASAQGAGADAIYASATGPVAVTVTGAVTSSRGDGIDIANATTATLTTAAGSSVSGNGNGASIFSTDGTTVNNGGTLSGIDFALLTTGAPATVNNTGIIDGAISLGGGTDVVNNSGTFNAVGTSVFAAGDVFNNSGVVAIAAGRSATLSGLTTFNNSGLIDMRNGVLGDTLTIGGNYVGSGNAALGVDVTPGSAAVSDRLVVGGAASGSTAVLVAVAPGVQPIFSTGTTIVQAGAASSANAFAVAPSTQNFGLVRYDVVYNPATTSYSLVAGPSDAAYSMLNYETAERNLWYKAADAITSQLQAKRDHLWNLGGTGPSGRFWVTMAASYDDNRSSRTFGQLGQTHATDTSYRQDYFGGQLGFDVSGGAFMRGGYSLGITGGYISSKTKLGNTQDNIGFDAVNGGAYASFTSGNIFATALGTYDYYWARPDSITVGFNPRLHGRSYGGRGELGIRFGDTSFFVEPVAQISYVDASLDPFAVEGTSINFQDRNGLRGKAGGRIGGNMSIGPETKLAFYAGGSYVHDFYGTSEITLANAGGSYTVFGDKNRDYGEAVAGINIASAHGLSGFMEATYSHTFGSGSNGQMLEQGAGGRAGVRVKF